MSQRIKTFIDRRLLKPVVRQIKHYRGTDRAAAWEFKREFFWNTFKALDFNGIAGDYAEFGSHGGVTFCLAFDQMRRRKMQRHMWAFDSFQGLPETSSTKDDHPRWKEGHMSTDVDAFHRICRSHEIPEDTYTVVPGFYEDTLTQMPADAPPAHIALAYIDCDMYSSTKTVLQFLAPRLKHGMVLAFDDYFCWSVDQISGERKALLELLASDTTWNFVRYRDYGWAGTSFVVERADLTSPQAPPEIQD